MIAQEKFQQTVPAWHQSFLALMPAMLRQARYAFCTLPVEAREDATQEVLANCLVAFVRLRELGKGDLIYASVLVRYAIKHYYAGRRVGNQWRKRDVYSLTEAKRQHIGSPRDQRDGWREQLVGNSVTPVCDQAAFRIDFGVWINGLPERDRQIALELASGARTKDVARKFKLSAPRVSQLRRALAEEWRAYHGETPEDGDAEDQPAMSLSLAD
jgi:hypothetical protein